MTNPLVVKIVFQVDAAALKPGVQVAKAEIAGVQRTADAAEKSIQRTTVLLNSQRSVIGQATQATKLQSHEVANLSYQLNDMVTMLLSGQSPFMMMIQQGPQVSQILGRRGLGQIIGAVGQGLMSLITPVNLVLAGMVAVGTLGAAAWRKLRPEIEATEDILKRQQDILGRLKNSYADLGTGAKNASRETQTYLLYLLNTEQQKLRASLKAAAGELAADLPSDTDMLGRKIAPGNLNATLNKSLYGNPVDEALNTFNLRGETANDRFVKLQNTMIAIASDKSLEQSFRDRAKAIIETIQAAVEAERALKDLMRPGSMAAHLQGERNLDGLSAYEAQAQGSLNRMKKSFDAQLLGINARSPDERAAAARAEAAAQYNDESADERRLRIEQAGTLALIKAKRDLTEAERKRREALDDSLASAELDLRLTGQSASEVARLKLEHQLLGQARKAAAEAGVAADEKELETIRQKAAEIARLQTLTGARDLIKSKTEDLARARLEQNLIGASAGVKADALASYEAEMEIRERGLDLYGQEAEAIRMLAREHAKVTTEIERQQDAWGQVQKAGESLIDSLVDGDWKSALETLKDSLTDLLITNPLKNELFGTNYGTMADLGGFQGLISKLFGGADAGAGAAVSAAIGQATGSMMVTAGTVIVNGGVAGGLAGGLGSLLGGDFKANTSFEALLGIGGAAAGNSSYAPGAVTRSALPPIGASSSLLTQSREAIAMIESLGSGGYSALGPWTNGDRAYGRYQVMGNNIPSWTRSALGRSMTPQQFLNNPGAQDAVFDHRFGGYIERYGNAQDAASMWFTGRPRAGGSNARDVLGTSGSSYVDKFDRALDKVSSTSAKATSSVAELAESAKYSTSAIGEFGTGLSKAGSALSQAGNGGGGGGGGLFSSLISMFGGTTDFWDGGDTFLGNWSSGGATGGSDPSRVAGFVHEKEFVIRAGPAQKFRPLLEAINDNRSAGYAEGGYVTAVSSGLGRGFRGGSAKHGGSGITFNLVNNGQAQKVVDQREEEDSEGHRHITFVTDDAVANALGRDGSKARKAAMGVGRRTRR